MSTFWIGGPKRIVMPEELKAEMFEDRYFLPGAIHGGEDYLIRVYLNDAHCDSENDASQFEVEYIGRELIREAYAKDSSLGDEFNSYICSYMESFGCRNDGSGDFASLVEAWPEAVSMSDSDIVAWAGGHYAVIEKSVKPASEDASPEFIGQIIDTFEDFLEEKGIDIPNDEKDDRDDPESAAIIYGTDYGQLQTALEGLLLNWGVIEREVANG